MIVARYYTTVTIVSANQPPKEFARGNLHRSIEDAILDANRFFGYMNKMVLEEDEAFYTEIMKVNRFNHHPNNVVFARFHNPKKNIASTIYPGSEKSVAWWDRHIQIPHSNK